MQRRAITRKDNAEALLADDPPTTLGQQTRTGISWNLFGAIATNAMRLVVVAVLGRTLDSGDFGIVAAAISVTIVLHNIRDIGIGPALVQRRELDREHIATAFAVSMYLGIGIAIGLVAAAPLIGELYRIPDSVDVLRALGLIFALRGVSTASLMMCQRAMNFRAIAIVDALSYAIGSAVSMTLALEGAGPWSLVAGYLTEESLSTVLYVWFAPPPFTLRIDRARLRDLLGFGAGQSVIQLAGILATYGDNFVVGNVLGKRALGYYTRAYDLIKFPSAVFSSVVGSVLFPAFSRQQDDPTQIATSYRRITFANALVLFPASAILIAIAPEAIRILMGENWSEAVLPFRILAISMMARTSYKVGAMVATATGLVNQVALANVVYMISVIGGAAIAIRWGIAGVAVSTAISLGIVYVASCYLAIKTSRLAARELVLAHVPGLVIASCSIAATWPVAVWLRDTTSSFVLPFVAASVVGVTVAIAVLAWYLRRGRGDFAWLATELGRVRRKLRNR